MRNRQVTEGHPRPRAGTLTYPLNPPLNTHTLANSCLCDWKVTAETRPPRQSEKTRAPVQGTWQVCLSHQPRGKKGGPNRD